MPLESIFFAALEKKSVAERLAFLDEACAGNVELRADVDRMLAIHPRVDGFLEQAPFAGDVTVYHEPSLSERPGTVIGPYKLLQQIGEGGMGVVFMADQLEPIRRKVALKIIKPGMDTRQVIARFEAERQALALMDHPNIARVFDAGATDAGRPYFVMELCKGESIAAYCDAHGLSIDERLGLLSQVCAAVQHAHTKGVIHRDIKPGNVLVQAQDGKPAAKVIDFGIAKATDARLTDRTVYTEHRQLIGTPEYMSPEQAEGSLDIDTRTDVYSLGVLMYELLTGSTPFSGKELAARLRALLLRPTTFSSSLDYGPIKMDVTAHAVWVNTQSVKLLPTEFKLLEFFVRHPTRLNSASELLSNVWGLETDAGETAVRTYVKTLRQKLAKAGLENSIETVKGVGYRLVLID